MDNTNNAESLLFEILSGKNKLIHPGGYDCKSLDKLKNFGDLLHDIEHSIQKYRGKYNQLLQERNELSDYNYLQKLDDINSNIYEKKYYIYLVVGQNN